MYDAVGVQVKDLPIRSEKVYLALRAAGRALRAARSGERA